MTLLQLSHLLKHVEEKQEKKDAISLRGDKFRRFVEKLEALIAALRKHRDSIVQQRHSQHEVSL